MSRRATVAVWDPAVRLFHWLLVCAFTVSYVTQSQGYELHLIGGYAVLALVAFRVLWGVLGTHYARFGQFVRGPGATARYLGDVLHARARRYLGHNPAGAAMIVALLLTLLVVTVSGVALDAAENRAGPLAGWRLFHYTDLIENVHAAASHACLALIILHVTGVLVASRQHRENLVAAMFTGRKRAADEDA